MTRHRWVTMVTLITVATLGVLTQSGPAVASTTSTTASHVVVLGVSGLTWDDISATQTPALYRLAEQSAIGSLVVRGVFQRTCAADGWLTIGAGARAVQPRAVLANGDRACAPMPRPEQSGDHWQIPGWSAIVAENTDRYDPPWGVLSDSLRSAGQCGTAVGPGAALMLADAHGQVSRYVPSSSLVTSRLLSRCQVTAVDLGQVAPAPGVVMRRLDESGESSLAATRTASLTALDREVARVWSILPTDSTLLLVSTADETALARLRVMTALGPGGDGVTYSSGVLYSDSSRRDGLVQITDVTPTVLNSAGAAAIHPLVGSAPVVVNHGVDVDQRIATVRQLDQRALVILRITFPVNQLLIVVALATFALFALAAWFARRRQRHRGQPVQVPPTLRHALRNASLVLSAIPLATYLVNVVPWWRLVDGTHTASAIALMLALIVAFTAVISCIAIFLPVLQRPFRAVGFIATTTVVVLALDVMTGSNLQFATLLGLSPIAAGRFFGFGNVAFAVFATAAIFTAVAASAPLVRRGQRTTAVVVVSLIGLACALIDGMPAWGADFGGMISFIAGFAIFAVLVSGRRLSWRVLAIAVLGGLAFAFAIAFADYLRPPAARTHLGTFMASLLDGTAWPTVQRKLLGSLNSLRFSWVAPLVPVLWALLTWITVRPAKFHATAITETDTVVPTLRHGLLAGLAIAAIGAVVNDSGIIVTATMLGVALPLAVAAVADPVVPGQGQPAPSTSAGPAPSAVAP